MSVIQSHEPELRYLKRKNLDEESKVIGNYYRDLIRSFGIDCKYHKLDLTEFNNFKKIIDQNAILKKAYGYNSTPDYSMTAYMITYPQMQTDIFQLQKFGINPQAEVDFYFDSTDFACALAPQCGQLKEYKIDEKDVYCEIPRIDDQTDLQLYPYTLKLKSKQRMYTCDMLSGDFQATIPAYKEFVNSNVIFHDTNTVICDPYEHTQFNVQFPVNDDLYRSLAYKIANDEYLETLLRLEYKITEIETKRGKIKAYLTGKLTGSVLFYDINSLGKYVEKIHPMVGDIVEIDFPDDQNREKYEITDCFDKQLTPDGISPLLHKYIWQCKARRYVNSYEDGAPESNEADARIEEKHDFDTIVQEEVAKTVSKYDKIDPKDSDSKEEDDVYGGYNGVISDYDKQEPDPANHEKYDYIDDGTAIVLMQFKAGSKLVTNGYDLLFIDNAGDAYQIATCIDDHPQPTGALAESGLRWLKASDDVLVFINVEGVITELAVDKVARQDAIEICLNDLRSKTLDVSEDHLNKYGEDNFFKFKGTRTYMFATEDHLYCKLASNKEMFQLI